MCKVAKNVLIAVAGFVVGVIANNIYRSAVEDSYDFEEMAFEDDVPTGCDCGCACACFDDEEEEDIVRHYTPMGNVGEEDLSTESKCEDK